MDKIKGLWGKYKIPAIIVAILLIAAVIGIIIYFSVKPVPPPVDNSIIPTGTQESSEPPEPVSEFVVPDIPSAPPSSAPASSASSSSVASKEPDIKVTGNTSCKAAPKPTSSKPSKVENVSSKPASPPASPATSSEQTPPSTSSELPPTSSELISEDGHTHGETKTNDDGSTWYYHIGKGRFIDQETWGIWGKYPQAKNILRDDGYYETDTSFLWEGAECWSYNDNSKGYWCEKEDCWISEFSWGNGYHKLVHPDYKNRIE